MEDKKQVIQDVENTSTTPQTQEKKKRTRKKAEPKQTPALVSAPEATVAPAPVQPPVQSVADKIWDHIKDMQMETFGYLSPVQSICSKVEIDPTRLYLTSSASAVLAFLSELLERNPPVETDSRGRLVPSKKNKYQVLKVRNYIVVELVAKD